MKRLDIPASSKEQILLLDRKMRIGNGDFDAATCSDFVSTYRLIHPKYHTSIYLIVLLNFTERIHEFI